MVNTFGTIKAKAAVKDSSRILGYPFAIGDRITKALPPDVMGKGDPARPASSTPRTRATARPARSGSCTRTSRTSRSVIDTARGIEGLTRGTGVHAAAVILSKTRLLDLIPLHMRDKDGVMITGFDYPSCEAMGLIKMDFLGLRNLGIIDHAIKIVHSNRGVDLATENIPLDDTTTYRTAGPRRHPRRLPARRRRHARAAEADGAHPVRGHRRRPRAVPARPDGRQRAHQLRAPQERPAGDRADPPGAGAAPSSRSSVPPSICSSTRSRSWPSPGNWPATPSAAPTCCAAPWARRSPRCWPPSGRSSTRACRTTATREESIKALWDVMLPVLRLRVQQVAHRRLRPRLLLDRLPQGQLPGRVHGRAAHLGRGRQGQGRRLPRRRAQDGRARCCRRT